MSHLKCGEEGYPVRIGLLFGGEKRLLGDFANIGYPMV